MKGEDGDTTPCEPVYIGPFWDVMLQTKNCAAMLRYCRRPTTTRIIWVDAISLNQLGVQEKDTHIPKMAAIYRNCMRVVVYLGKEAAGDVVGKHPTRIEFDTLCGNDELINAMLQSRYFTRVWVIQELTLPRQLIVPFRGCEYWADRTASAQLRDRWRESSVPWMEHMLQQSFGNRTLGSAIRDTWSSNCADSRDKLFAILGLLKRDHDRNSDIFYFGYTYYDKIRTPLIQPDHTISTLQLFVGLSVHLVMG
ncbi:heterokaryon incompatibility protein-domain-containing protein [Podospora fimiseda]|uniref:Heterokaryon incompatibility protein-domain-containing protein n=1 Tax=Podospora fimiseda TaxID=252190 RepID=A0AAN7BZS7_9PEZI|nr:heterokaryon incompatibility protein-domain-containing protein [Podospora fimiseda]